MVKVGPCNSSEEEENHENLQHHCITSFPSDVNIFLSDVTFPKWDSMITSHFDIHTRARVQITHQYLFFLFFFRKLLLRMTWNLKRKRSWRKKHNNSVLCMLSSRITILSNNKSHL